MSATVQSYEDAVAQAAQALKRGEEASWDLARLTHESTLRGREKEAVTGKVTMAKWCADVRARSGRRFAEVTGFRYAKVWATYGAGNGTGMSSSAETLPLFNDAYAEVEGTPNRERMMEYEHIRLVKEGTPEQKVKATQALLEDPDVVEAAADPETPMSEAVEQFHDQVVKTRLEEITKEPTVSMNEVKEAIKKGKEESVPYQYSRFAVTLSTFFLAYTPEQVAEALASDRYSQRLDTYITAADRALDWFTRFRAALQAVSRPRIVRVPAESAS